MFDCTDVVEQSALTMTMMTKMTTTTKSRGTRQTRRMRSPVPLCAVVISLLLLLASESITASGQQGQQMRRMVPANRQTSSFLLNPSRQQQQQQQQHQHEQSQQQTSPEAPKLIPLSALDRYQEGADLRLFCSASAAPNSGRLHFEWRKDQVELPAPTMATTTATTSASPQDNPTMRQAANNRLSIQLMDESSSVLRINQLDQDDSGNYTCLVRNQHGSDSATVRVNVNVKLKWIIEPPGEVQLKAGKSLQLECDASGQPEPQISWTSVKDLNSGPRRTIKSKVLRLDRVTQNDSGLYECRAVVSSGLGGSGHHQLADSSAVAAGEQLRKLVRLIVNGK